MSCIMRNYRHLALFKMHFSVQSVIEIDFIISNKSKLNPKLFPIKVKSSKPYATKSLDRFGGLCCKRIGEEYVIHTKELVHVENRLHLPAYMTFCL